MKKIIAEVVELPNGWVKPALYCLDEDGEVSSAITNTVLDVISESGHRALQELNELIRFFESGGYAPRNPALPDWSVNDKNIWLVPPRAASGNICVSNENISDYSEDDGIPQQFPINLFRVVIDHWNCFQGLIKEQGLVGMKWKKYEIEIPDF